MNLSLHLICFAKFFDLKLSKERVLSSKKSETGNEAKKNSKEQSSNESEASALDDIFAGV